MLSWLRRRQAPLAPAGKLEPVAFAALFPAFPTTRVTLERLEECIGGVAMIELGYLAFLARWLPAAEVFEIGTSQGRTTLNLALNLAPGGHIHSLDLPAGYVPEAACYAPAQEVEVKHLERAAFLKPYLDRLPITLLEGESTSFDFSPWFRRMDLVFVDGGHTQRVLETDSRNAFQLIKPGGLILWHDYTQPACPEVTAFLDDLGRQRPLRHVRGTRLVIYQGG